MERHGSTKTKLQLVGQLGFAKAEEGPVGECGQRRDWQSRMMPVGVDFMYIAMEA
jgi:hypothetical protein